MLKPYDSIEERKVEGVCRISGVDMGAKKSIQGLSEDKTSDGTAQAGHDEKERKRSELGKKDFDQIHLKASFRLALWIYCHIYQVPMKSTTPSFASL